jgi:uncharacterized MAPEG superfamily protein
MIAAVIIYSFHSGAAERAAVYLANAWIVLSIEDCPLPISDRAASRQRMVVTGLALQQYFG